jgi:predicted tellurium resistance membrane protein TerC
MDFSIEHFITLGLLILLQAVLGFDNLLYISLESKKAPEEKRQFVRTLGIGLAIVLRIGLLFLLIQLVELTKTPWFDIEWVDVVEAKFNFHSLLTLFGGVFIIYTAMKEIWHMLRLEAHGEAEEKKPASLTKVVFMIVLMNLVFSFDSILSTMALTDEKWVMVAAILISGGLMIYISDHVAKFLAKNRMYEVLGLFILFLVGIMLVTEGGELAHMHLFGNPVEHMEQTTFYFVLAVLVLVDIVQGKYQKKLLREKEAKAKQETES